MWFEKRSAWRVKEAFQPSILKHIFNIMRSIIGENTVYSNCSDGEVRLAGKVTPTSGRLEICFNKAWGTVCGRHWSNLNSHVACRQLGYQAVGKVFKMCCYAMAKLILIVSII